MRQRFSLIGDLPTADPQLGFAEYADTLAEAIREGEPARFTIGIYGPWGTGKSSLLHAIMHRLDASDTVIPVFFDAWRYDRGTHIVVPLMHAIQRAVRSTGDAQVLDKVTRALRAFISSLTFTVAGSDISFDATKFKSSNRASAELVALDTAFAKPFEEMRELANTLGNRRIAVLIDDLDRCSAANVVAILEAINVVMDVEGIVFVLALDYDVLVKAIEASYQYATGHEFIEKLVQLPFRVPRPVLDKTTFLTDLVPQLEMPRQEKELTHAIAESALNGNPRQIKRFINAYFVLSRIVQKRGGKIAWASLMAVVGLQLRWPDAHRELVKRYAEEKSDLLTDIGAHDPELRGYLERFVATRPSHEVSAALRLSESVATPPTVPPALVRDANDLQSWLRRLGARALDSTNTVWQVADLQLIVSNDKVEVQSLHESRQRWETQEVYELNLPGKVDRMMRELTEYIKQRG